MPAHALLVAGILLAAIFTQTVSGFGVALVSMPLLVGVLPVQIATPLVAVVSLLVEAALLRRYRQAFHWRAVARLALAAVAGIPVGLLLLRRVDAGIVVRLLGLVVAAYALYALFSPRLPRLAHPAWAYTLGFLSGLLGGAYNTSGPPVIVYGSCRQWAPATFKGNLQGYFLVISSFTLAGHAVAGNLGPPLWRYVLWALPAVAAGIFLGAQLDGRVKPERFRRLVLLLLLVMGLRLLLF